MNRAVVFRPLRLALALALFATGAVQLAHAAPACGKPPSGELTAARVAAVQPTRQEADLYEGPVWIKDALYFSDFSFAPGFPSRIRKLALDGSVSTFIEDSGSNGLALDNADQLLLADQVAQRITRVNSSTGASLGELVPSGQHKPNDLILRSDDNLYFTDPDSAGQGLYRVSPTGQLSEPIKQSNTPNAPGAPNGVVLSPDENTLYVGDVQQRFVAKFSGLNMQPVECGSEHFFALAELGLLRLLIECFVAGSDCIAARALAV